VAVAAPHQGTPARRRLPVAADTGRLRQCPPWTAPSGHRSRFRQHRGHRAPRQPSGRPRRTRPQPPPDSTADRPATTDRRQTLQPSAGLLQQSRPALPEAAGSAGPCWSTRPRSAQDGRIPASGGTNTGRAFRTPAVPQHLTQRRPRTAAGCCASRPGRTADCGSVRHGHCWRAVFEGPSSWPTADPGSTTRPSSRCPRASTPSSPRGWTPCLQGEGGAPGPGRARPGRLGGRPGRRQRPPAG
jgi:hypothetical protein